MFLNDLGLFNAKVVIQLGLRGKDERHGLSHAFLFPISSLANFVVIPCMGCGL